MTVLDVAGGRTGGAARFRQEAARWVAAQPTAEVRLVGMSHRVEPRWLLRRELVGRRERRIAANNVSFVTGCGPRIVLLNNALHFLRPGEGARLPAMPAGVERQVPIVRRAAQRADVIVVPCNDMAERVQDALPGIASRVAVRHQPYTVARRAPASASASASPHGPRYVLYPVLPAPHKDIGGGLRDLVGAIARTGLPLVVKVTCDADHLGDLARLPGVDAIGPQSLDAMDAVLDGAAIIFMPSTTESYGYPVAEARALGRPVVAVDTAQNREIGGQALIGFAAGDTDSLARSLEMAMGASIVPDPQPFGAPAYFAWLTTLSAPESP